MQPGSETHVQRRHRFLLRTASKPLLRDLHEEGVKRMSAADRAQLLAVLRDRLAVGHRAGDDPQTLSRLIVLGELRQPGTFLWALDPGLRERLAGHVVGAQGADELLGGYDAWDGEDPAPRGVDVSSPTDSGTQAEAEKGLQKGIAEAVHFRQNPPWG